MNFKQQLIKLKLEELRQQILKVISIPDDEETDLLNVQRVTRAYTLLLKHKEDNME
jgi:hypothetical protein